MWFLWVLPRHLSIPHLNDRSVELLPLAIGLICRLEIAEPRSSMGQRQVSMASMPSSSTVTLCVLHSSALSFQWAREEGRVVGPPRHCARLECFQSFRWKAEKTLRIDEAPDNRGAESCVRRECPAWREDMKPNCMDCLLAPAVNPLLDLSHISHYEIRPCTAESASHWSGTI